MDEGEGGYIEAHEEISHSTSRSLGGEWNWFIVCSTVVWDAYNRRVTNP